MCGASDAPPLRGASGVHTHEKTSDGLTSAHID